MNRKITFLMFAFWATMWNAAIAQKIYDFKVGKLYYKKLSATEVDVCPQKADYPYYEEASKPAGDIVIPDSVTYERKKYHVLIERKRVSKVILGCGEYSIQD